MSDTPPEEPVPTPSGPPQVFQFLDYRAFLSAWLAWKKEDNPRYSHRLFARQAGVSSVGLLSNVIAGRRNLSPANVEAFAHAIGLHGPAREVFSALVDLDQADEPAVCNEAMAVVLSWQRHRRARTLEGDSFTYLSRWVYPAVRELVACDGFREDPSWIAGRLGDRVSADEVVEALDTLLALGLVQRDDQGRLEHAEQRLRTSHEVADLAAYNYHREMIAQAAEALDAAAPDERHLLGATIPVSGALIPTLKEELNSMLRRLLDLVDGAERPDRVMQLNLQLVPLSCAPEEDE